MHMLRRGGRREAAKPYPTLAPLLLCDPRLSICKLKYAWCKQGGSVGVERGARPKAPAPLTLDPITDKETRKVSYHTTLKAWMPQHNNRRGRQHG